MEASCVRYGVEAGIGEGKVYADVESCTALVKALAPLIFSWAFAVGRRRGYPGLWGAVAAGTQLLAQCCMVGVA